MTEQRKEKHEPTLVVIHDALDLLLSGVRVQQRIKC